MRISHSLREIRICILFLCRLTLLFGAFFLANASLAYQSSGSGAFPEFELPLVPYGSYLEFCSYSQIDYQDEQMHAVCGFNNKQTAISLDELSQCYANRFDIAWNGSQLACDSSRPVDSRMLGRDSPPFGYYFQDCSGALFDSYEQRLYATCRSGNNDEPGHLSRRVTSLQVGTCHTDEWPTSVNGQLECGSADSLSGENIPFGRYLDSCLGWKNKKSSDSLTAQCEHSSTDTVHIDCVYKITAKHYYLAPYSFDRLNCDESGLDICFTGNELYCTRALEDHYYFNFQLSAPPAGRYLQKCNHLIYDRDHDVLNANCAVGDATNIFYNLPDHNTWAHHCHEESDLCHHCSWDSEAKFYETRKQAVSALENVSQCVDANGVGLLDVDAQGKLYCLGPGDYELTQSCGQPTTPPTSPSQPTTASPHGQSDSNAIKIIVVTSVTAVVVVAVVVLVTLSGIYGVKKLRTGSYKSI